MGNAVGNIPQSGFHLYFHPEITPSPLEEPTFDPNIGFPNGRQKRVMIATKEEMISAKVPLKHRDYCAHHFLKYKVCRKDNWPWAVKCEHEKHILLNCQYDDYLLRMKEYERERRLRVKAVEEKKAQEKQA